MSFKKIKLIFLFVAAFPIFFLFFVKFSDYDTWFHLATGRRILSSLSVPQFDIFSYTAYGTPWHLIAWGFDAFLYGCYKFIGLKGISILWGLFSLLLGLAIAIRSEKKKDFFFSFVLIIPVLIAINYHWPIRPEVTGYIFFSIFLYLVSKEMVLPAKIFFLYIFLNQLLWTNFHLSSMNAFFVTGVLGLEAVFKKDITRLKKLILLFGVLFLAAMITPYGPGHFIYGIKIFFASHTETSQVREMMPMGMETLFSFPGLIFLISTFGLIYLFSTKRYGLGVAGIVFFLLTIKSTRFLNFYLVFIAPFLIDAVINYMSTYEVDRPVHLVGGQRRQILACALSILSFLGVQGRYERGIGIDIFNIPVNGVEFILKNEVEKTGNMFNTLNFGGYLDWQFPEKSVYIDGRLDMFIQTGVYKEYLSIINSPPLWEDIIKKRNISYAIVRYPHLGPDGRMYNNTERLFPIDKWALVYFDETAIIYVRRDAVTSKEFQDLISRYEYHYINPQKLDPSYMYGPHFLQEFERNTVESPKNYRAHFYIAYIYNMLGPSYYQKTYDELMKAIEINRDFKEAKAILKNLHFSP